MRVLAQETADHERVAPPRIGMRKMRSIEWLGQTVASVCWIVSVLVYGIESTGDWLQLAAASSWFAANMAALATAK